MDLEDQHFVASNTRITTTKDYIQFTGNPNAQITVEYDVNYEVVPKEYIDAFNMSSNSVGNPSNTTVLLNRVEPNFSARVMQKGQDWLSNNKGLIKTAWKAFSLSNGSPFKILRTILGDVASHLMTSKAE